MTKMLPAVAVVALLTSCVREPKFTPMPISFSDHSSILRGTWNGTVPDGAGGQALVLDLMATYVTSNRYTVSGTGTLGTDALSVTGSVEGGVVYRYVRPQNSPIPANAWLTLTRGTQPDLMLWCAPIAGTAASDPWHWSCHTPFKTTSTSFTLTKGTPIP